MHSSTSSTSEPLARARLVERLLELAQQRTRLLVLTHCNPDPDSLASSLGLRHLVHTKLGMRSDFGLAGRIMRAENKEMVRSLGLDMLPVDDLDIEDYDCIALVDTQPGFGHTTLPDGRTVDIVIDHHVPPETRETDMAPSFVDIRTEIGATSSMVTGYLMDAGVEVPANVATALFYGIRTDTADLARNASPLDEQAYNFLISRVDRGALARITRPALPLEYYKALRAALNGIRIFGHVVLCSLGKIPNAEMVAEVADLLLRLEDKQAVFCGGLVGNTYHVSVRCEVGMRDAWFLIRDALGGDGTFGGHGTVAGGSIVLPDDTARTMKRVERKLERNILRSNGLEGTTVIGIG